jgi:hypothetical protein
MPKIPMPELSAPVGRVSNLSPVSGGKIQPVRQGEDIADALGGFKSSIERFGGAVAEFRKEQENTENELAAAEAQNLYTEINDALIRRMAENPGAFGEFEKWSNEADELFRKQERQFTDRMTPEFRKKYSLRMQANIIAHRKQRIMTGMQSKVTADYNLFQKLFKEAAEQNQQQALNLLEQHRGKLISEQEYQIKKEIDLPRTFQFADARRRIDAGESGIIEQLEAQDSKGNYVNFTAVSPEKRRSLLSYAKAKDSQTRANENLAFLDMLNSGSPISKDTVEASFEGRTSPEDLRQKMEQLKMVDRFESARERATTAANEKKEKDDLNSMLFDIVTMKPPAGEYERAQAQADWERKIYTRFAGNGNAVHRLKQELSEVFKASNPQTANQSYKNSYIYQYAFRFLSGMKKDFYSQENEADRSWWNSDKEDSKEVVSANYKMAQVALDAFIKNNPHATNADVETFLQNLKKDVNKTEVGKLIGFWTERGTAPQAGKTPITSGEVERSVNGRIAIFGKDHKFIRWKDGK